VIKDIQKGNPSRCYAKPKPTNLHQIAIPKLGITTSHPFMMVILDL
jgi:hypothetical protein